MSSNFDDAELRVLLDFLDELAALSAAKILPVFRSAGTVENKATDSGFDPVTVADRDAEQVVRQAIAERYPKHGIVGEEFGVQTADTAYTWVIDPIDGTRGFIAGLPTWGTLIGFCANEQPLLGMMNQPYTGERYTGSALGAYLSDGAGKRRLTTRPCASLKTALLCATHPRMFSDGEEAAAFARVAAAARDTRFGTDCYGYCALALGQVDLVVEADLKIYDVLPLIPIIEASGGVITDWEGNSAVGASRVIAAGDLRTHTQVIDLLAAQD